MLFPLRCIVCGRNVTIALISTDVPVFFQGNPRALGGSVKSRYLHAFGFGFLF